MSWETDYSTTLPGHDPDTIRSAALTAVELCPRDDLLLSLQMLGLARYDSKPRPVKGLLRPPPDVDRMRALRAEGYSLAEIGRRVGLHGSTVGDHLNGRRRR